ncbi:hypothetical protein FNV43_RR03601 [Rhamnella rubrinervis]|uniref:Pseudouridine-5'-phosphate glycosidase n=1 Tax=Rhamnella rubrinervis TaxID=2594499 RepID=A0A8K0HK69_9ROSA|nr:hypothetical protein FNV43_RR03601 [Rhamnella rubrinervis]
MASSSSSSSSAVSRISNLRRHLHPSHSSSDNKGAGLIKVSPEVSEALSNGRAVVALESTIISHGMPYPLNLETAQEVEANVRENGAVPATIAILDGIPCVGLSQEELGRLATLGKQAQKTARRDIAHVVATRGNGATTVSATMFIASLVGISVFVTGGIGGVHRHGEDRFNKRTLRNQSSSDTVEVWISSDLTELGRTPVAVISAGVKSILDIPRTLEYLETQEFVLLLTGQMSFQHFHGNKWLQDIALVKNNALVGAEIAVALTQLRDRCTRDYYVQATEYLLSAKIVYAADEHVRKLVIVAIHSAALSFLTVTLSEQ